jgi:hypothetical protein
MEGLHPRRPRQRPASEPTDTPAPDPQPLHTGNASGSTLRLTLGCLLAERLGIQLRRMGSGRRLSFAAGEAKLLAWMADNAYVTWPRLISPGWRNGG